MENSKQRIRFVCVSDTHGLTAKLEVPPGDVLIHAGDFTNYGEPKIIEEFNDWLGSLPHSVKIVIAGNHERTFDTKNLPEIYKHLPKLKGLQFDPLTIKGLLTNCTYLEDNSVNIYGYKIYGSPWGYYRKDCAFHVETPEELAKIWSNIPNDTDILVTHYGTLDLMYPNKHVGEKELMKAVRERVKPLIHIFGHIHESYGITQKAGIHCINASTCTIDYVPSNRPIVFDLPNKSVSGH